ncbi:MAG: response regulator [Gemmatimonadota bacterium]|nr:response regulator [Gemmatimonadota bacterium]
MTVPMRLVVVDDDAASRAVVRLAFVGHPVDVAEYQTGERALDEASGWKEIDAIVLDVMMPGLDGVETCRRLRAVPELCDVPIIMVTAAASRATRHAAIDAGVDDFLAKPLDREELRVRVRAYGRQNRARRIAEMRAELDRVVEQTRVAIVVITAGDGVVRYGNLAATQLLGGAITGSPLFAAFNPASANALRSLLAAAQTDPGPETATGPPLVVRGTERLCTAAVSRAVWQHAPAFQLFLTDVTAEARAAAHLRQFEQTAATARLAATVAHDLGSVLQIAMCHLDGVASDRSATELPGPSETGIRSALARGALLVGQLLAHARRQVAAPAGSCDASAGIERAAAVCRKVFGPHIDVVVHSAGLVWPVGMPDAVLEQIVINLLNNARDAMPRGGRIAITVDADATTPSRTRIQVSDNGTGMDANTLRRAGEPFFTTKAEGQGTGLGLFSVQSSLATFGGSLQVASSYGAGTTCTMLLPATPSVSHRKAPAS